MLVLLHLSSLAVECYCCAVNALFPKNHVSRKETSVSKVSFEAMKMYLVAYKSKPVQRTRLYFLTLGRSTSLSLNIPQIKCCMLRHELYICFFSYTCIWKIVPQTPKRQQKLFQK